MRATSIPLSDLAGTLAKLCGDRHAHDLDLVDLVEFVAGTGVRISEARGLAWSSVSST